MKWGYKLVFIILILITVGSATGSLYFYSRVNATDDDTAYQFRTFPKYYFSLILNTEDDVYWQDFKRGATEAGKAYNVAINFNTVTEPDADRQIMDYINSAIHSKADGIIVSGENTEEFDAAIQRATDAGINVVMAAFEMGKSRTAYVGTNNHEYGRDAAKLISQTRSQGQIDVAVILSGSSEQMPQDRYMQTMISGVSAGEGNDINIVSTLYRTSNLLGAEDQIRSILRQDPSIDVIFCTNAKDTVSAAHVIVERNLVGKVDIVGTGINDEIISYIEKDIIFGVVDKNGHEAGYKSVKALYESMGGTFISSYTDIKTDVYTKANILSYVKP